MKHRSAKRKGRSGQAEVVTLIQNYMGLSDDDIRSSPASVTGMDIELTSEAGRIEFPFAVEVKRQERLNIFAALEQAAGNAGELLPLVVFRRNNGEWQVALKFEFFLWLYRSYWEML